MGNITKEERARRAALSLSAGETTEFESAEYGEAQPEAVETPEPDNGDEGEAEPDSGDTPQPSTVRMVNPEQGDKLADVHPDEVNNWQAAGWRIVE